jgi:hypothetical protein
VVASSDVDACCGEGGDAIHQTSLHADWQLPFLSGSGVNSQVCCPVKDYHASMTSQGVQLLLDQSIASETSVQASPRLDTRGRTHTSHNHREAQRAS